MVSLIWLINLKSSLQYYWLKKVLWNKSDIAALVLRNWWNIWRCLYMKKNFFTLHGFAKGPAFCVNQLYAENFNRSEFTSLHQIGALHNFKDYILFTQQTLDLSRWQCIVYFFAFLVQIWLCQNFFSDEISTQFIVSAMQIGSEKAKLWF